MDDFIALVKEGFRLVRNVGQLTVETVKSVIFAYYAGVRKWTVRLFIAAFAPLVVIVPCLFFHAPLGWLYGVYVVWLVLLLGAELSLITPLFFIWRRVRVIFPTAANELIEWIDFINSVLFNGLSLGIFVTLFPIWRSPGAFPVLILVFACWLTLPTCAFSRFCKRIYPTVRGFQLVLLAGLLVLRMAFPRQMEQLGWTAGRKIGGVLTASVEQKEVTEDWKKLRWFDNAGEPLVWFSASGSESYRLWAAPGFDPDSGKELLPVEEDRMRQNIVASLSARERTLEQQAAAVLADKARTDEAQRRNEREQLEKDRATAARKFAETARLEEARRRAEQERIDGERARAVRAAEAQAAKKHSDFLVRYFGSREIRAVGAAQALAVLVVTEDGRINGTLSKVVVDALKTEVAEITASQFTQAFVSDGLFAQAFVDPGAIVDKLSLTNCLKGLFLARQSVQYSTNTALENLITASMNLDVLYVRVAVSAESRTFSASGVGFKPEDARALAEERLSKNIQSEADALRRSFR